MNKTLKKSGLYLLFAAFLAPLIVAFIAYYGHWIKPQNGTEHGILIQPTLNFAALDTPTHDLTPFARRWVLVYIVPGACHAECAQALHLLRQLHVALGKDSDRVRRVVMIIDSQKPLHFKTGATLSAETPEYGLSHQQYTQFLNHTKGADMMNQQGGLFIVDPNGNAMLYYPPMFPPKGVLEDMKHVLKLSHIG
jgi:cytochrome oxidase Cu insertion factor (SCO1/SenC/PrrC family)